MKPIEWAQRFVSVYGYAIAEAQTARTMPMFSRWVAEGVTIADVDTAFGIAVARHGEPPRAPSYLDGIVADLRAETARAATVAANDAAPRGNVAPFRRGAAPRLSPQEFGARMVALAEEERARAAAGTDVIEHDAGPAPRALPERDR